MYQPKGKPVLIRLLPVLGLLVALAAPAIAQDQSVAPGINRPYHEPDYGVWVQRFERPGREIYDRRNEIVAAAGIRQGMVVADIGAGTGLFTRLFSPRVGPDGRVIAVDISDVFIDNIMRSAAQQGLSNIDGVVNTPTSTGLAAGSVDLAFVCDTYHHFEYPQRMLASIHSALRPGGELIIIDFRRIPGYSSSWVMGHVRTGKQTVVHEIEAAGFRFVGEQALLRTNYFLRFSKK